MPLQRPTMPSKTAQDPSLPLDAPVPAGAEPLPERFELAMQALESLVDQMESGQLPLEDMLTAYQRGAALVGVCKQRLMAIEQQVSLLDGDVLGLLDAAAGAENGSRTV